MDTALGETVCQVCVEGHDTQYHWVCACNHTSLVAIRDSAYHKVDELLQTSTTPQQAIGRIVLTMAKADDGHGLCGGWNAANLRTARVRLPDASLHDVKWTLKLVQPHLIQMVHAILTRRPIP